MLLFCARLPSAVPIIFGQICVAETHDHVLLQLAHTHNQATFQDPGSLCYKMKCECETPSGSLALKLPEPWSHSYLGLAPSICLEAVSHLKKKTSGIRLGSKAWTKTWKAKKWLDKTKKPQGEVGHKEGNAQLGPLAPIPFIHHKPFSEDKILVKYGISIPLSNPLLGQTREGHGGSVRKFQETMGGTTGKERKKSHGKETPYPCCIQRLFQERVLWKEILEGDMAGSPELHSSSIGSATNLLKTDSIPLASPH